MKIIYYLKNLKLSKTIIDFIKRKSEKLGRNVSSSEALIEVDLIKDKEIKGKEGPYKVKLILDLSRKSLIIVRGAGKNLMEAVNSSFKKLTRQLRRRS